jgi:uncharacterized membrane protein
MAMDNVGLAVLYGILSVISLNVGLGIQKYGLSSKFFEKTRPGKNRKIRRSLVWFFGTGLTGASVLFSFQALAIGNVSLMASLGGVGLVTLALFSYLVLKEMINKPMLVGVLLIAIGTTVFGYFTKQLSIVNIDLTGLTIFVSAALVFSGAIASASFMRGYRYGGIIFGTVAGLLAGIGVTLQKCSVAGGVISLGLLTNMFFYAWAVITGVSFLVTQFAFTKGTAIRVVPSYNSATLVLPQIGAIAVFGESIGLVQWIAVLVLVVGIILLTRFKEEPAKASKIKTPPVRRSMHYLHFFEEEKKHFLRCE